MIPMSDKDLEDYKNKEKDKENIIIKNSKQKNP